MRVGVVTFPGSNCDHDCLYSLEQTGFSPVALWHQRTDLDGVEALILPGGFSYGDYLRTGAIARFAPIMKSVADFAAAGKPILGICNGFQILLEAGLLPGVLLRNESLRFICRPVHLRVETDRTPFTRGISQKTLSLPIAHAEGNYFADESVLEEIERSQQVAFRYVTAAGQEDLTANPNGSRRNIAGICNKAGNVVGLMPHPDRRVEDLLGGTDGRFLFEALRKGNV